MPSPTRTRLPADRAASTRVFRLTRTKPNGQHETMHLYFTAGVYPDGRLGEVFIKGGKMGSLTSGALDAVGTLASLLLQYGVPLQVITSKLRHTRYEPNGFTRDVDFPSCSSALDLLAQWLERKFGQNMEGK